MAPVLLELKAVRREHSFTDGMLAALKSVDLTIYAGEMVAIVGPSGSGKSTLMNILGCLDRPTSGSYEVAGRNTALLDADALSVLRRERFGFIFQRYNLLAHLNALGNAELPAIYTGMDPRERQARAASLLSRLGLRQRLRFSPHQLSGGEQQRVSIARALMNDGDIILADEPTGALDSHSGDAVLSILKELHDEGHTVILVTHDANVAARAQRVIELKDGEIVRDHRKASTAGTTSDLDIPTVKQRSPTFCVRTEAGGYGVRTGSALRTALPALQTHPLRTFLTMLGIIIGIASVASVVALGEGGRKRILDDIRGIGSNTLDIYPGRGLGEESQSAIRTLTVGDAQALAKESYVDSVTPDLSTLSSVHFRDVSMNATINGVGDRYFRVHDVEITAGHAFSQADVRKLAQVAVIDEKTRQKLFATNANPIGEVIFLRRVPMRVIGVARPEGIFGSTQSLNIWTPYTSALGRILGPSPLRNITTRVRDHVSMEQASRAITRLLIARHGRRDFFILNSDSIRKAFDSTSSTMSLLISSIAVISLVVGGIGVMNTMLVAVTERTQEIGIRMAAGARQRDIMLQFLIEAVFVCLAGGVLGVFLALLIEAVYSHLSTSLPMIFSPRSIIAALGVSTLIGVAFGYFPARQAARLDPVEALGRE